MTRSLNLAPLLNAGLDYLYDAHHQAADEAAHHNETSTLPALKKVTLIGTQLNGLQIKRLEKVFSLLGYSPRQTPDPAMAGITAKNEALIAGTSDPAERDLINIGLGQLAAHFFITHYGTLREYALRLDRKDVARLLQKTLNETGRVNKLFTGLSKEVHRQSKKDAAQYGIASGGVVGKVAVLATLVVGGTILLSRLRAVASNTESITR